VIAAILLAAGESRRMGSPKALLPWGDQTLIAWEIEQLRASVVDQIVVVLGAHAEVIRRSLGANARLCTFNQRWAQGRSTSLAKGAAALLRPGGELPEATVIQNVDQPTRPDITDALVARLREDNLDAIQPEFTGHGGHPVVVGPAVLPRLLAADDTTFGLRGVLADYPPLRVESDDPVVAIDLDTPDRVPAARELLGIPLG
jgi:molybdenum cofactor cytidylyltransferase